MIIIKPITINDAVLTSSDVSEVDEAEYNPATSYALNATVMRTTDTVHGIFISLQAANVGNSPEDDDQTSPVFWSRISATNRWGMFSDQINDQTEQSNVITVALLPASLVNGMTFFNLEAQSVNVTMNDPTEGEVYNVDFDLVADSGVNNWYLYYFEPILRQGTVAVLDLPPYIAATITVTITNVGETAKCGLLSFGAQAQLGITNYSSGIGITDYSRKERDQFGNALIVQRNFSKRADYSVTVATSYVGYVQDQLSQLRTVPLSWIGAEEYESTVIYGYFKDFSVVLSNPSTSLLSIDVEGLT